MSQNHRLFLAHVDNCNLFSKLKKYSNEMWFVSSCKKHLQLKGIRISGVSMWTDKWLLKMTALLECLGLLQSFEFLLLRHFLWSRKMTVEQVSTGISASTLTISPLNDETKSSGTSSRTSAFVSISQYTGKCPEKYKPPLTSEDPPSCNTFL